MSDEYKPVKANKGWIAKQLANNPSLRREYEARGEEYSLIDELIRARKDAGLTQRELAERIGKKQSSVGRLESTLADPNGSVSLAFLRKYAAACGKRLDIKMLDV